jgi:ABC-type antimicrobial peptide transport system permease subunit
MGIISRAIRNLSRRKVRSLLVIIALSISLSIMVSIPAGLIANEKTTSAMANSLGSTITSTSESINATLSQITVTMNSNFAGFGFNQDDTTTPVVPPSIGGSSSDSDIGGMPQDFGGFGGGAGGQFGGAGGQSSTPMNASLYTDIEYVDGVAQVEYMLEASEGDSNETMTFMGRTFTTQITDYTIRGISLTEDLLAGYSSVLPSDIVEGRNLQVGDSQVVLLSQNNTVYFNATVGDEITILNETYTVIGTYEPTSTSDDLVLYMNLSDTQRITNNTGYITSMVVFTENSDIVDTTASAIEDLHTELTVTTQQDTLDQLQRQQEMYQSALDSAESSLATTQATATQEIIVVVAATSMIVLFVMLYTVRERTKEIGTLKAIGFSNNTVMGQFLIEGLVLSALAGVIGIILANFVAPTISSILLPTVSSSIGFSGVGQTAATTVEITSTLMLEAFGGAIALGIAGSLYPAWRAAKIRPAEAMRYE